MSSMNADDPVIAPAETGRYRGDPQPVDHDQILILDFGSQTAQLIARRVREQNVFCRMVRHDLSAERIREINPRGPVSYTHLTLPTKA